MAVRRLYAYRFAYLQRSGESVPLSADNVEQATNVVFSRSGVGRTCSKTSHTQYSMIEGPRQHKYRSIFEPFALYPHIPVTT